jgi:Tol biopolymer transport system component/serine/threonine protein kinase
MTSIDSAGNDCRTAAGEACPSEEELRRLVVDDALGAGRVEIIAHLDGCPACRNVVAAIAGELPLGRLGPADALEPPAPAESALFRIIEKIKDESPTARLDSSSGGGDQPVPLDFLSPADEPAHLGRLGRYTVQEEIGRGASGIVLKALDDRLSRIVALKVLSPRLATNEHARRRFVREAKAAAAIRDDHVIGIYHVEEVDGLPFLVMEYVVGRSLAQRLEADGPLPVADILRIGGQIARGLAAAHAQGLVHRDIKPANILLENGVERVKITDFGLAHAVDDVRATQPGVVIGTPEYMSPEQARGERVDLRSDLFSLGCVLYAMCAGRPPFRAESTMAVLRRICEDTPRPLTEINPDIPTWLAAVIDKLIAKSPTDRFQSAAEVAQLLEQCLSHVQQPCSVGVPPAIASFSLWERVASVSEPGEGLPVSPSPTLPLSSPARKSAIRNPKSAIAWPLTAAILLVAAALVTAETTGLTTVASSIIKIVRGDGTLVIEVDDPSIQVLLDGDEIAITGAGPKELRLRPGKHELQTVKDGTTADTKLVTVTRDGREVVKVSRDDTKSSPAAPVTRLVWDDVIDSDANPSPDGRQLTFVDWSDGGNIAIRDLPTGRKRRLTNKPDGSREEGLLPVFSADGKSVFYVWFHGQGIGELRMISADGGKPRTLFADPNKKREPYPHGTTPDLKSVLTVIYSESGLEIALINVDDGSAHVVKSLARGSGVSWNSPRFSPDGKYVAYPRLQAAGPSEILLLDLQSGTETRLHVFETRVGLLDWAPDSQRLLFKMQQKGNWDVWSLRVNDGQAFGAPQLVKADVGQMRPVGFTRNGTFLYSLTSGGPSLFTATLDLTSGKAVATPVRAEAYSATDVLSFCQWSPTGEHIAYKAQPADRPQEIRIVSPKTGERRTLQARLGFIRPFRWSPDGKSFLMANMASMSTYRVFSFSATDGSVTESFRTEDGNTARSSQKWSPDGSGIYFMRGKNLVLRDLSARSESPVFALENSPFEENASLQFDVSPDGKYLAVAGRHNSSGAITIQRLAIASGELMELVRLSKGDGARDPKWTADGNFVVYLNGRGLWYVPSAGGTPRLLDVSGIDSTKIQSFDIHPDGKQLALNIAARKGDIWALENFLPPLDDAKLATAADVPPKSDAAEKKSASLGPLMRPVWTNAADVGGAPSPDGKFLTFTDWTTGDLSIRDMTTGVSRKLTNKENGWNSGEHAVYSVFSPDGTSIAYDWFNDQSQIYELRTIAADGSNPRLLCRATDSEYSLSPREWSRDGRFILVQQSKPRANHQIGLVDVADGSLRAVKDLGMYRSSAEEVKMCLSPDGKWIAFAMRPKDGEPNRDIWLVSTDGAAETTLVDHPADDSLLGFSPDGGSVLFASNRRGTTDAWLIRVADGKPTGPPALIKADIGEVYPMGLTRDGALFYSVGVSSKNIYLASLDPRTGKVISAPVLATQRYEGSNSTPDWSPDGKFLAYISNRQDMPFLCLRSMEDGSERDFSLNQKAPSFGASFNVRWSPDGRSILVGGYRNSQGNLVGYLVDAKTGEMKETRGPLSVWLPDGKSLVYRSGDRKAILRRDPDKFSKELSREQWKSDPSTVLYRSEEHIIQSWAISPDGQQLAYTHFADTNSHLTVVPMAGGNATELVRGAPGEGIGAGLTWSPDSKKVIFVKGRRGDDDRRGTSELWQVSAKGGEPEKLGLKYGRQLRVHPDGNRIAFASGAMRREVWAMENFLPPLDDPKRAAAK